MASTRFCTTFSVAVRKSRICAAFPSPESSKCRSWVRLGITLCDALYLAGAEQQDAALVTADRRLFEAARGDKDLRARVRWIADA